MTEIYLGTVALEPNRWATVDPSGRAMMCLSEWMDQIATAGFVGLEVWERHLTEVSDAEVDRLIGHELGLAVFNSYVSFDLPEPDFRLLAADWIRRSGASGVKYNVGNDPASLGLYAERLAEFTDNLPDGVRLLCECHEHISIAEDPAVASRLFELAGGGSNLQAICHLHEDPDYMRSKFEHLGGRISHVHVNFLDHGAAPRLAEIEDRLSGQVRLLEELGFDGTWTIEFAHGALTDHDEPGFILDSASDDLRVLRSVIDG